MNKFYQLIQEWGRRSLGDILVEQFRRFKVWWLKTPPNPWPEELDEAVAQSDSKMVCPANKGKGGGRRKQAAAIATSQEPALFTIAKPFTLPFHGKRDRVRALGFS